MRILAIIVIVLLLMVTTYSVLVIGHLAIKEVIKKLFEKGSGDM